MSMTVTQRKRMRGPARRAAVEAAAASVFAERGYHSASVAEIAVRAGVSVPVLYDHFPSKVALYAALIERHYAELRAIWGEHALSGWPVGEWLPLAIDAWFAYVADHPFAARILFRDAEGDAEIGGIHRTIRDQSREALLPLLASEMSNLRAQPDALDVELAWETQRAVLQGLAVWWADHPGVARKRIVDTAVATITAALAHYAATAKDT
jgi:AcrR family transcriptional regulator